MSLEKEGTQYDAIPVGSISDDDAHCLASVLDHEAEAQKAFTEAQAQKKYKLQDGDSIQRDGTIVRAE